MHSFFTSRGLNSQDFEYAEMNVEVNGRRIKVDPRSVTLAQYKQMCPIEYCPKIFKPNKTEIIAALLPVNGKLILNSPQKPVWICYDHVKEEIEH